MSYLVSFSDGRCDDVIAGTYEDALEVLRKAGCEAIGHAGDLSCGGDRTLGWKTEAEAENDDGARAVASVLAWNISDSMIRESELRHAGASDRPAARRRKR